ncbi:MAG: methionyl-tRNA formyltransferase [Candidatus Thorarchaeota archaeon]
MGSQVVGVRIFIATMDEPIYVGRMIRGIINAYHLNIVGVAILPGSPVSIRKGVQKIKDAIIFSIILGPTGLISTFMTLAHYRLRFLLSKLGYGNPYSIESLTKAYGIPCYRLRTLNNSKVLRLVKRLNPDLVINQAQVILRKQFLDIPRIGTLNRHASLLPRYRGMMAPFWSILHNEQMSGVSIHFVDEQIDHGPIVIQKTVPIKRFDTFIGLLERIFDITPDAMLEAIEKISQGDYEQNLLPNEDSEATYFSKPNLSDALRYYSVIVRRFLYGTKKK